MPVLRKVCFHVRQLLLLTTCLVTTAHLHAQTQPTLIAAIQANDVALARTLLDKGADPNAKDANGTPMLVLAAEKGGSPLAELLLAKGAKIERKNRAEQTALIAACSQNNLPLARLLLAHGANPNAVSRLSLLSPLAWAIKKDNLDLLRALLDNRANPNLAGLRGDTPLILAIRASREAIITDLLKQGAAVNTANIDDESPLMIAAGSGNLALVNKLLALKANVSLVDQYGQSALFYAVRSSSLDCLRTLASAGASFKVRDKLGRTPMMVASGSSALAIVSELADRGADIDARDKFGATALMRAARRGDEMAVKALVERRANVTLADSQGHTAAWRAEATGCSSIAQSLNKALGTAAVSSPARTALIQNTVQSSIKLLEASASGFRDKVGGTCFSCHNQSQVQYALGIAKSNGFVVDEKNIADDTKLVLGEYKKGSPEILKALAASKRTADKTMNERFPGAAAHAGYGLLGLDALKIKRDAHTEAVARYLPYMQEKDGHWQSNCSVRAPSELSNFTETALALFAIRRYTGPEFAAEMQPAIARGRAWLETSPPKTTEDRTFQLFGLVWAGADRSSKQVESMVQALRSAQRLDGGWTQEDGMSSDAYATGEVLVALHTAGGVPVDDPAYRKGVDFLLRTAEEDGSWFIRSRALPFQGYIETGYPYRHDQFISISAATWATAALAFAAPKSTALSAHK